MLLSFALQLLDLTAQAFDLLLLLPADGLRPERVSNAGDGNELEPPVRPDLPNMFFGYGSSETEAITHMTEQAMTIGGVYTSLRSLEESYMNYKGRLLREEEHPNEQ